jgi:hypothetical protein
MKAAARGDGVRLRRCSVRHRRFKTRRVAALAALRKDEGEQPAEHLDQASNGERDRQPNEQNGDRHEQNDAAGSGERNEPIDERPFAADRSGGANYANSRRRCLPRVRDGFSARSVVRQPNDWTSGLSASFVTRLSGGASRLASLLLPHILPGILGRRASPSGRRAPKSALQLTRTGR